jgi:hypothetical protein
MDDDDAADPLSPVLKVWRPVISDDWTPQPKGRPRPDSTPSPLRPLQLPLAQAGSFSRQLLPPTVEPRLAGGAPALRRPPAHFLGPVRPVQRLSMMLGAEARPFSNRLTLQASHTLQLPLAAHGGSFAHGRRDSIGVGGAHGPSPTRRGGVAHDEDDLIESEGPDSDPPAPVEPADAPEQPRAHDGGEKARRAVARGAWANPRQPAKGAASDSEMEGDTHVGSDENRPNSTAHTPHAHARARCDDGAAAAAAAAAGAASAAAVRALWSGAQAGDETPSPLSALPLDGASPAQVAGSAGTACSGGPLLLVPCTPAALTCHQPQPPHSLSHSHSHRLDHTHQCQQEQQQQWSHDQQQPHQHPQQHAARGPLRTPVVESATPSAAAAVRAPPPTLRATGGWINMLRAPSAPNPAETGMLTSPPSTSKPSRKRRKLTGELSQRLGRLAAADSHELAVARAMCAAPTPRAPAAAAASAAAHGAADVRALLRAARTHGARVCVLRVVRACECLPYGWVAGSLLELSGGAGGGGGSESAGGGGNSGGLIAADGGADASLPAGAAEPCALPVGSLVAVLIVRAGGRASLDQRAAAGQLLAVLGPTHHLLCAAGAPALTTPLARALDALRCETGDGARRPLALLLAPSCVLFNADGSAAEQAEPMPPQHAAHAARTHASAACAACAPPYGLEALPTPTAGSIALTQPATPASAHARAAPPCVHPQLAHAQPALLRLALLRPPCAPRADAVATPLTRAGFSAAHGGCPNTVLATQPPTARQPHTERCTDAATPAGSAYVAAALHADSVHGPDHVRAPPSEQLSPIRVLQLWPSPAGARAPEAAADSLSVALEGRSELQDPNRTELLEATPLSDATPLGPPRSADRPSPSF